MNINHKINVNNHHITPASFSKMNLVTFGKRYCFFRCANPKTHFLGSKAIGHGTVDLFVEGGGGPKHHKNPRFGKIWMVDFD